jgi:predicted ATPase
VDLSDTGEGLTQILPVLVASAMAAKEAERLRASYLVIEQPELHLHPAAHAPLAAFLCEIAARSYPPRMLIETHSENFLFGVQLAIANGQLDPSRVIIYWVQQDAEGNSTLSPIQLDADGRPDFWPPGVFMEETELARRLIEARRQRQAP